MEKPKLDLLRPEIREAYTLTFNTEWGRIVLADLEKIVGRTTIDANNPNPYSAVYRNAQQALLARIANVTGRKPFDLDD